VGMPEDTSAKAGYAKAIMDAQPVGVIDQCRATWMAAVDFKLAIARRTMEFPDALQKARWTVLAIRIASALKQPERGIKQAQPTNLVHPITQVPQNNWALEQEDAEVSAGSAHFVVPGMYSQAPPSRWQQQKTPVKPAEPVMDAKCKAFLQEELWQQDRMLKLMETDELEAFCWRGNQAEDAWGKAVMTALHLDSGKAITQAFGIEGSNIYSRVTNVGVETPIPGVIAEQDVFLGYPLFSKTSDGVFAAIDGSRGNWGELRVGSLDHPLVQYELGDTALNMAVRNGKWSCAAALVAMQGNHPLNAENADKEDVPRHQFKNFKPYQQGMLYSRPEEKSIDVDWVLQDLQARIEEKANRTGRRIGTPSSNDRTMQEMMERARG